MQMLYLTLFLLMLLPALLTVAFAARSVPWMIWNYAWFLILSQVGLRAFASEWGALPGFCFAIQYAFRTLRARPRPIQPAEFFTRFGNFGSVRQPASPPAEIDDVIEAEFHHEKN